jgi:hypothetical protein
MARNGRLKRLHNPVMKFTNWSEPQEGTTIAVRAVSLLWYVERGNALGTRLPRTWTQGLIRRLLIAPISLLAILFLLIFLALMVMFIFGVLFSIVEQLITGR